MDSRTYVTKFCFKNLSNCRYSAVAHMVSILHNTNFGKRNLCCPIVIAKNILIELYIFLILARKWRLRMVNIDNDSFN
jgi:hypothetical protein